MGFPCNQFGKQEPDSEADIKKFVTDKFGVSFPMFSKVDVNGPKTHPVYAFIKQAGEEYAQDIGWNFEKFLVDKEGQLVKRFKSKFDKAAIEQAVEKYL
eukprot:1193895-Prorocentrum_minimum.AAC.1